MWRNIGIGSLMMVVTTTIHATFMMLTIQVMTSRRRRRPPTRVRRLLAVVDTVLLMFAASLIEVTVWAATYAMLGAVSGAEPALYFSTVTFTTLGYGDLVLEPRWRLLASFEAANGIIMFGWTTAIVLAVVQRAFLGSRDLDS